MAQVFATRNPSDKNANIALSNGNLTATSTNGGNDFSFRATISVSSGKRYWEFVCTSTTQGGGGIGTSSAGIGDGFYCGFDAYGYSYIGNGGTNPGSKIHSNSFVNYGDAYTTATIGVALDMDNLTIEFFKNGVSQGVAYTGITAGSYFPMNTLRYTTAVTVNFGATAFTYSPPSGFNAGVYTGTPDVNKGNMFLTF